MKHIFDFIRYLDNLKDETLIVDYQTYRAMFSAFEVPTLDEMYSRNSKDGSETIYSVRINRLSALNHLTTKYGFVRKNQIEKTLHDT